jgi:UDP-N-acetylmuramate--alanine ligase
VNAEMVLEKVTTPDKQLVAKEEVLKILKELNTDIVVTIGAGDIDTLVEPIRNLLKNPVANN